MGDKTLRVRSKGEHIVGKLHYLSLLASLKIKHLQYGRLRLYRIIIISSSQSGCREAKTCSDCLTIGLK